jgi:hypothetical protein
MNKKESLIDAIGKELSNISEEIPEESGAESMGRVREYLCELLKEQGEEEKSVQVCVLFKNKYLMAAKAKRSDAMDVGVLWRMYRENPGKETDAFITIGCDEEMLMFSLSSVDAIKVLFSQKDVGL